MAGGAVQVATAEEKYATGHSGPVAQAERLNTAKVIPSRREFVHNIYLENYVFFVWAFARFMSQGPWIMGSINFEKNTNSEG